MGEHRKPGRPLGSGAFPAHVRLRMTAAMEEAAQFIHTHTGRSVADILREWLDLGRRAKELACPHERKVAGRCTECGRRG